MDVSFLDVTETSGFGDPVPLFGPPTISGNGLNFFPLTFSATVAGGGVEQTGSQLQTTLAATGGGVIATIAIDEFGDVDLSGVGTAATGTFVSMAGAVTVLETTSGPIAPIVVPFAGTFTPSDLLSLPGDLGVTLWSGSVQVDVGSVVPNATRATLSFDNDLVAASEIGTTALVQKKTARIAVTTAEPVK